MGNATALFNLSNFYYEGMVVEKDVPKAMEMLKEAADAGEKLASRALAILIMKESEVHQEKEEPHCRLAFTNFGEPNTNPESKKDFNEILERAEKNDPEAQFMISEYYAGEVSPMVVYTDKDKRFYWLERAAENDYPDALFKLGLGLIGVFSYWEGGITIDPINRLKYVNLDDIPLDPRKGIKYLKRGADLGSARCMRELCKFFFKGKRPYISQNTKEAVYWGEKCIETGGYAPSELESWYFNRKKWDKYLNTQILSAERSINEIREIEEELKEEFDYWVQDSRIYPWLYVERVANYFYFGGSRYPGGMVVEQSYEKALEWYSHIPERFQDKETVERVKQSRKELGK